MADKYSVMKCITEALGLLELSTTLKLGNYQYDDLIITITDDSHHMELTITLSTIMAMVKVFCKRINSYEEEGRRLLNFMGKCWELLYLLTTEYHKDFYQFIFEQNCVSVVSIVISGGNHGPTLSGLLKDLCVLFMSSDKVLTKFMPPDWTSLSLLWNSRYKSEFRELQVLGTGGYGKVYKVENNVDGGIYAIKKIHLHVVNETPLEKVAREVKLMASLQNEHIVRYITAWWERGYLSSSSDNLDSVGTSSSASSTFAEMSERLCLLSLNGEANNHKGLPLTLFVQMELCETTVEKVLESRNVKCCHDYPAQPMDGVDDEWAKSILYQILIAVEYLHSQSMMHRDLKPANIFLDKSHKFVKLGDFGLARIDCFGPADEVDTALQTLTQNYTEMLGTKSYAAPEQLSGSKYDKKADMYSVGIINFELFYPFGTHMERSNVIKQLRQPIGCKPEVDKIEKRWPDEAARIRALLNHDPRLRPSAQDLLSSMSCFKSDKDKIAELSAEIRMKDATIKTLMERLKIQEG